MHNNNFRDDKFWTNTINTTLHNAWAGLSFEIVCLLHIKEIKFSNTKYTITKTEDEKLRERIETYRQEILPQKAIHLLMLTTFGVKQNKYSGIVQNEVTLEDLFAETD